MKEYKLLFSGFRDPDHSKAGGYDWITGFDGNADKLMLSDVPFGTWSMKSKAIQLPLAILDTITRIRRRKYDITHLIYGDVTLLRFIPYRKSKKHKTVITVHMDIEKRKFSNSFVSQLRSFDRIIVLSSNFKRNLKEKYGLESEFIPHGFNAPRYQSVKVKDETGESPDPKYINIVTVGKMYRDYDVFHRVVSRVVEKRADLRFHVVGAPAEDKAKCRQLKNVRVYPRLENDEYNSLLEKSDYCFLPLSFATANNSLFEAQYLNLPLILPRIEGVSDYAYPEAPNMFYESEEELEKMMIGLRKPVKDSTLSDYAQKFSWENIYHRLDDLYKGLLNG